MSSELLATIGVSGAASAVEAGRAAAEAARMQQRDRDPQVAMVFASSWFDQSGLLEGIRQVLPVTPVIGGSTAGELSPEGPTTHHCVLVLLSGDAMVCRVGVGEDVDRAPREAGHRAASRAADGFPRRERGGFLFFGYGLAIEYADVLRGLREVLGTGTVIAGALMGDDLRYDTTYQYAGQHVATRAVAGLLIGGTTVVGAGLEHGYAPISKPRRVTRAERNVLFELDHQPAAAVYEEYFGHDVVARMRHQPMTRPRLAFPLGLHSETADRWLLRNVTALRDDGSLVCSGEVLDGAWLQLMIGSRELALAAARRAAQHAVQGLSRVAAVLVFDSVARRLLLGPHHAAEELRAVRGVIGPSVPLAGCYTYGEHAVGAQLTGFDAPQTGAILVVALGTPDQ